jgi:hypothetical protein
LISIGQVSLQRRDREHRLHVATRPVRGPSTARKRRPAV